MKKEKTWRDHKEKGNIIECKFIKPPGELIYFEKSPFGNGKIDDKD
jgi:hypothetical protein